MKLRAPAPALARITLALLALVLPACAHGELADDSVALPLGSFCLSTDATTPDATSTCLDPAAVTASVTRTATASQLRIRATVTLEYTDPVLGIVDEDAAIAIDAQVAAGAALPAPAEHVDLSIPATGTCRSSRPSSPFGGACGRYDGPAICQAAAYDDDTAAAVDVAQLDGGEVAGRFTAALAFAMPQGCCANDGGCPEAATPAFTPDQPLPVAGSFHLALEP